MVRFYMDEGVDGPITDELKVRGVDVLIVQADGRSGLKPDSLVLDRATELQRVIVCQDKHFLQEAQRRQKQGIPFAGVIYAPKQKEPWGVYIDNLEMIAGATTPEEFENQVVYLPLP